MLCKRPFMIEIRDDGKGFIIVLLKDGTKVERHLDISDEKDVLKTVENLQLDMMVRSLDLEPVCNAAAAVAAVRRLGVNFSNGGCVLLLDKDNRLLGFRPVKIKNDIAACAKTIIDVNPESVVICYPGIAEIPPEKSIQMVAKLGKGIKSMGIKMLDFIIIDTEARTYFSFNDEKVTKMAIPGDSVCPWCGSHNWEWMGDEYDPNAYHCHECDNWFGPDDLVREPIRHRISAMMSQAFANDEEHPLECSIAVLSTVPGRLVEKCFQHQDGTLWFRFKDESDYTNFDDITTDVLKEILDGLERQSQNLK